jgi:hypothetical protein
MGVDDRARRPGEHARRRYRQGLRRWRAHLRFRVLAALSPAYALGGYLGLEGSGRWQWFGGAVFGSALTMWLWVRDSPPHYIENWNLGFEGERRTGRALAALPAGWRVWHDLPAGNGNFDHIVLGPAGLFVVDSKLLRGELCVDGHRVRVRRQLAGDDYGAEHVAPAVVSRAMELRAYLRNATHFTEYVQAVVVAWSPFPQTIATTDRCVFIAGDRLLTWLGEQPRRYAPAHVQRLAAAIDDRAQGAAREAA